MLQGIINLDNDKWRDMNVLSSLLKTFFRRLPDSLITTEKYKQFIQTNRLPDPRARLIALKELIKTLPDCNYETLKYLALHLRKVAEHGENNKVSDPALFEKYYSNALITQCSVHIIIC